jgi:DNA-binding transcriptional LysR family regulator
MPWAFHGWKAVDHEGPLDTDDGGALRMATLHGAGIAYLLRFAVEEDLADGSLVELLPELQKPGIQVYALHAFRDKLPARARVFLEFLHARLSNP